jgi:hypothetical protein
MPFKYRKFGINHRRAIAKAPQIAGLKSGI